MLIDVPIKSSFRNRANAEFVGEGEQRRGRIFVFGVSYNEMQYPSVIIDAF